MNLPNFLTLIRIMLTPVLIFLISFPLPNLGSIFLFRTFISSQQILSLLLFLLIVITDFLDGYLSRKLNIVTTLGKFLDPIADKILVLGVFIFFVYMQKLSPLPVFIIIAREFIISGYRMVVTEKTSFVLGASLLGKIKTIFQFLTILFLIIDNFPFNIINFNISQILIWISATLTFYSGFDYIYQTSKVVNIFKINENKEVTQNEQQN